MGNNARKMRIQLPNPHDYLFKEDQFWEQLDLSIYHAKKVWEKVKKQYDPTDTNSYPWIQFNLPDAIDDLIDEAQDKEGNLLDENRNLRQEISIGIEEM